MAKATVESTITVTMTQDEANAVAQVLAMVTSEGASPSYYAAMRVFDSLVEQGGAKYKSIGSDAFPLASRSRVTFKDGA